MGSPSAYAAKKAKSIYAVKILGTGILSFVRLSTVDVARLVHLTNRLERYDPSIFSAHGVIKGSYVYGCSQGMNRSAALAVEAAGLEAKILNVPGNVLLTVDRNVSPRQYNVKNVAGKVIPKYYKEAVSSVKKHTV